MSKDKGRERKPGGAFQEGTDDPDAVEDPGGRGEFAGDNRGIQDDKSQGDDADRGQRPGRRGNTRGGSKG